MDHRKWLRADCARCEGLCCVSLAFDRGESFSFDKGADVPCQHLLAANQCAIHERLAMSGHAGCANYDCYGAGQRVTQEIFRGISWRTDPQARRELCSAFRDLKHVHELRFLLHEAARLELCAGHAARLAALLARLEPQPGFSVESLRALDIAALRDETHALLRELRGYVGVAWRPKLRLSVVS